MPTTPPTTPKKSQRPSFHVMSQNMVTLRIGSEATPFRLHKDLLCYHSDFFRRCFNGSFNEAKKGHSTHRDVKVTIFKTFVHWLYFQEVLFDEGERKLDERHAEEAVDVYMFADRFDIRGMRNDIIDVVSSYWSKQYRLPPFRSFRYAFEVLPDNSSLTKYFIACLVYAWHVSDDKFEEDFREQAVRFSPEVLWKLFASCKNGLASKWNTIRDRDPLTEDNCQYHEHESVEDKAACKSRKGAAQETKFRTVR